MNDTLLANQTDIGGHNITPSYEDMRKSNITKLVMLPILGIFLIALPACLMLCAHHKVKQLTNKLNVSVNILNVWLFKCMILGLLCQIATNFVCTIWQFMVELETYNG
jgi:hypothetical protein